MSTRIQARDPNEIAIERAVPGLTCDWVHITENLSSVEFRLIGSAQALIESGVIDRKHIEIVPPCGYTIPGRKRCERLGITWQVEMRRLESGHYRVRRWYLHDQDPSPRAIAQKYGLQPPLPLERERHATHQEGLTPQERSLVAAFRCAHPEGKAAFESLAAAMMEQLRASQRSCGDRVRERAVGRFQRLARWHVSGGKLITIDWRAHRVDA